VAEDVASLVNELQAIVDADSTAAVRLLNRRHRQMVARGQSYKTSVSFVTVANQAGYAVVDPSSRPVLEVHNLTVDGGEYTRGKRSDAFQYAQGLLSFDGYGLFLADGSSVTLVPTPTQAGLTVSAFCSLLPPDLNIASVAADLKVDQDLLDALVDGAAATELTRIGEGDPASLEAKFSAACEELRSRERRRFFGGGPAQIRIIGVNA
jgi:hypothetical protein